mgnify:FL=1
MRTDWFFLRHSNLILGAGVCYNGSGFISSQEDIETIDHSSPLRIKG